jgi:ABC-type ATPase involved in cell division
MADCTKSVVSTSSRESINQAVMSARTLVGLKDQRHHLPNHQLSAGQEERVAIAPAIVTDPTIILTDQPTESWTALPRFRS